MEQGCLLNGEEAALGQLVLHEFEGRVRLVRLGGSAPKWKALGLSLLRKVVPDVGQDFLSHYNSPAISQEPADNQEMKFTFPPVPEK